MKRVLLIFFVLFPLAGASLAQRLAVLQPRTDAEVPGLAEKLKTELAPKLKLIDDGLADAAFRSVQVADPFNMSAGEAKLVGAVVGCDRFLILRSAVQRRAASGGRFHFEAYAAAYLVDSRDGLLIRFDLSSAEADKEEKAAARLVDEAPALAARIAEAKLAPTRRIEFPEPPPENSPEAAGLRLPVPYKRIRPEYTTLAALYGIKATVDAEADIDADGRIAAFRIVRWAGFGLDESVESAVRSMNWRPAMRGGKSLPMRVLLRYNFRKIEKDEEN